MASPEDEACRRLMIWLCGSEAKADEMRSALMRLATMEQEEVIKSLYKQARQRAANAGKDLKIVLHPRLQNLPEPSTEPPPLSPEEEAEFDDFMRTVCERVEGDTKRRT